MEQAKKVTIWNSTFVSVTIANIAFGFSHFLTTPLIAPYASFLGATPELVGLLAGLYSAVAFLMRPVTGPAMTTLNKKKLMIVTFALGILVNLIYAFFGTVPMFVFGRILHGLMYGFVGSLCMTIASDSLPREKYASGFGIFSVSGVFGQAIGPSVGIWLQELGQRMGGDAMGYRFVFLGGGLCYLIGFIFCFFLKGQRSLNREERAALGPWYKSIIALPSLPFAIMMAFYSMSFVLFATYMVTFGEQYNIANIGLFFILNAAGTLAARPIGGPISDRKGPKVMFIPGTILFAVSFIMLAVSGNMVPVMVAGFLGGFGWGLLQPAVQATCMSAVPTERSGAAANTNFLCIDFGFFIGPTIGGIIFSLTSSYHSVYAFGIVPIVIAVSIYAVYTLLGRKKISTEDQ